MNIIFISLIAVCVKCVLEMLIYLSLIMEWFSLIMLEWLTLLSN